MDGGAWWATVHGVTKSQTQLSDFTFTDLIWDNQSFKINELTVSSFSHVWLFATPWTAEHQASLSITNSKPTQTHVH